MIITSFSYASDFVYEKRDIDNHVIHLVLINPKAFDIAFVKSNDGAYGRETVPSMANRSNATIAINGGFFEIGNCKDGVPSGTLIIDGHVYSLKNKIQPLLIIDSNKLSILDKNPNSLVLKNISALSGIPLLISDGKIFESLYKKDGQFYINAHARTAIGITSDGSILIAVIEHHYPKDNEIKLPQAQKGLTILQLAQLLKDQGCEYAINLDGGGSSTLWIDGKVVNQTMGDADEWGNLKAVRAVSDAVVFSRKDMAGVQVSLAIGK